MTGSIILNNGSTEMTMFLIFLFAALDVNAGLFVALGGLRLDFLCVCAKQA